MKRFFPVMLCVLPLTACDVPNLLRDDPAPPQQWSGAPAGTVLAGEGGLKEWWKQFHDPNLDWLIEQTQKESPDIRQAAARIEEARGLEKSSSAELMPLITGNADAARGRSLFFAPITATTYDATFDASYEIDLFGKNRKAANASELATKAAVKESDWVKLSMMAEVTRSYIFMRAAEKQIALAEKNLGTEKDTLGLVQRQRKAGGANDFDLQRASIQVNQSAAAIADWRRQQQNYLLSLVTLTGLPAEQIRAHMTPVGDIPGIDLTAVADAPASVLAHRPDIAAANLRLAQATNLKESQAAAVFPDMSVSGLFGISKSVLVDTSTIWSVGANAAVNLLDFGRIQGQIDASAAREQEAYEIWRKSILQATQDVETALNNVAQTQQQRVALAKARNAATSAMGLAGTRYRAGDSSLLDVLDTQRDLIDADSALINAESQYVTSIVALYKALGQY